MTRLSFLPALALTVVNCWRCSTAMPAKLPDLLHRVAK
jgi:hypothetical protein